jgi:hypothetical protein
MATWFRKVRHIFNQVTSQFAGQPILYVEIGVWEADSAEACCRGVLTHPQASGVGIDSYKADRRRTQDVIDGIRNAAVSRMSKYPQWSWRFEKSYDVLADWNAFGGRKIDLLYIDGSHHAHDALLDFCLAGQHLRKGSVVLFDDYAIGKRQEADGIPRVPTAVGAVLSCFKMFVEPIPVHEKQFALRVVKPPIYGESLIVGMSRMGPILREEMR